MNTTVRSQRLERACKGFSYVSLILVLACVAGMAVVALPQYAQKERDAWDDLRDAGVTAGSRACSMLKNMVKEDESLTFSCSRAQDMLELPEELQVRIVPAVNAEFHGDTYVLRTETGCRIIATVDGMEGAETRFYKYSDSLPMPAD